MPISSRARPRGSRGLFVLAAVAASAPARAAPEEPYFDVYGFAQADYVQDFERVNPAWEDTLRPSRIPTVDGQYGSDGQAVISARQSRLGVKASLPLAGRPLDTKFEIDMFGVGVDEGQTTIRLRHAYGEWGPILAGQTHSLFMDIDAFPNVFDYWGPCGMVFYRLPQIRVTPVKSKMATLAFAIERPGSDIDPGEIRQHDPSLGEAIRNDEKLPDLTGQIRVGDDSTWGHVQLAGIGRLLGYDSPGADANEPKGGQVGWGADLTTNFRFGKDKLILGAVYGHGIASYMNDGGTDLGASGTLDNPDSAALPLFGGIAYLDHTWAPKWTTSLGYSLTWNDNSSLQSGSAFHLGQYASANLFYAPNQNLTGGLEVLWGARTDKNDDMGTDFRTQISVKYTFSSKDHIPLKEEP